MKRYRPPSIPFKRKFLPQDIDLLVEVDKANDHVCGPATACLLNRAFTVYGDARFERLSTISVSPLYNLRKTKSYQKCRAHFTKTLSVGIPIGVRKAPDPQGRAGYVRIESVHQGDWDGAKGVYHITCVDEVSQSHIESCVQGISEAFLLPVLTLVKEQKV
jgi:hypothetical protein